MGMFVNTITIARPIEDVFGFLADLENLPAWNHALVTTRRTSEGPIGVGSTFHQTRSLPAPAEEHLHVTLFDAPNALGLVGDLGPFRAEIDYALDTVAGGTRITNRIALIAPSRVLALALPALTPKIKAAVGDNLRVLRSLLESPALARRDDDVPTSALRPSRPAERRSARAGGRGRPFPPVPAGR